MERTVVQVHDNASSSSGGRKNSGAVHAPVAARPELAWGAHLHPWNKSFQWQPTEGPYRRITEEQADSWNENGFLLFEDAFRPDELRRMLEVIDPIEAAEEELLRTKLGGKAFIARADEITFTLHLARKSEVMRSVVASDVLMDLTHDLVGPDAILYWDMSVYKKPGTAAPFPWHQDNGYTYVEPQQYVTFWIALTDATVDNGCPWVIPGWHRLGTLRHRLTDLGFVCFEEEPEPEHMTPVPVKAGSIAIFSSLTPHTTGPNLSDATRKSYIVEVAPTSAESLRPEADGTITRTVCRPLNLELLENGKRLI